MTPDDDLLETVRAYLIGTDGIVEKGIVGGVGFLRYGNLACGVMRDGLLVRIDKGDFGQLNGEDGAEPMVMAGRVARGWLLVSRDEATSPRVLEKWIGRGLTFADSLPPK